MDRNEVEQFLYEEARLLDEHCYSEWLSLWTDDAVYWVPCAVDDDPHRSVSIIYDDRSKLADRVAYLAEGSLSAQQRPTVRRVVSNVVVGPADIGSNFVLTEARGGEQHLWCGRVFHRLRREGGALRISFKKVLLVNAAQPMPILQFLL